jgi:type IV secretory pathway VirB10-like protein
MDSFWVKIGILIAVCVGLVVLVKHVKAPKIGMDTPNFYEVTQERDKKLRAEPVPVEPAKTEAQAPAQPQSQQQPAEQPQQPAVQEAAPQVAAEPQTPAFKELSEEDSIEAEKIFNQAVQFSHIGHLPGPGYKTMVDGCRELIQRFPGSEYAWKAKRMLKDMPEQYRERYHITPEEIDLGNFK